MPATYTVRLVNNSSTAAAVIDDIPNPITLTAPYGSVIATTTNTYGDLVNSLLIRQLVKSGAIEFELNTNKVSIDQLIFSDTTIQPPQGTTGDSGTKTATFNGATQTNFNALGAIVTVLLGTVSGTTPTLAPQMQWSPDGGTNWLAIGPAMANLTATSQTGAILFYPTNMSQAPGSAPANLTTGATQTLAINMALPRTWRILYTIGGTTPSFAISSVQVNYLR